MTDLLEKYDDWLTDGGPAALVIREYLMPVEGRDGAVFPPTFAAGDGFPGGYNIDGPFNGQPDGENVCLIDSVGSQGNRVEPMFAQQKYQGLVPQIIIKASNEKQVNLLDAGHRAGDAIARCTELASDINTAFKDVLKGNAAPLAKIAPTSLVFGVWDSRDTQAKLPRIVGSTIRAFNVRELTRSAVYVPPLDYSALEVFSEEDKAKAEGNKKSPLAQRGFVHNPASGSHGGVIATGGIRRDATLNLAALRLLRAARDEGATLTLRRYILGLSLIAFTHPSAFVGYLRQGCTLVLDPDAKPSPREFSLVHPDGKREEQNITHDEALAFAKGAAASFGVGENKSIDFNKEAAKKDVVDAKDKKGKNKKKKQTAADMSEDTN
ncbi:MAG TPA: type I-U CRISPR-associated RAMP protein Csb1/Cas7u [Phycisphaerales bacterium]|nr:type I-U CRISPR-associated RAMP protein Csb1/Cas7u [Phycisphaerales bacterium]HRQ74542.1 type I-U CRISPR-associated RAMP protein Csb1/Cas7u [Phycisphaerales bacterium]